MYNKLLENIALPLGDLFTGNSFISHLKKWRAICDLDEITLQKKQKENLNKLLTHASSHIPYYQSLNINKETDPEAWLKAFPLLTKDILKTNQKGLLGRNTTKLFRQASSGSSGIQAITFANKQELSETRALQILWWEWAGYKMGDPLLQTGINPNRGFIKKTKDILLNTTYVPAFQHSEQEIINTLTSLKDKKNYTFAGYASSLYVFATVAQKHNLNNIRFKTSIAWGDKLFAHYRKTIERAFKCKVHETYGSAEGLLIAAQYDLDYMYIMSPHVYLEILDENGHEVPDGEMGYVVITRLDNYSMPLIRYYIGDMAIKLPKEKYPKNRKLGFPLLEKVIGRDTDIIKTHSGKFMVVHSFTGIFEHIPEIKQFKVIQKDLNSIEIHYVPDEGFDITIIEKIKNQIHGHLREPLPITFKDVENISPSASGKPQIIESHLPKEFK